MQLLPDHVASYCHYHCQSVRYTVQPVNGDPQQSNKVHSSEALEQVLLYIKLNERRKISYFNILFYLKRQVHTGPELSNKFK